MRNSPYTTTLLLKYVAFHVFCAKIWKLISLSCSFAEIAVLHFAGCPCLVNRSSRICVQNLWRINSALPPTNKYYYSSRALILHSAHGDIRASTATGSGFLSRQIKAKEQRGHHCVRKVLKRPTCTPLRAKGQSQIKQPAARSCTPSNKSTCNADEVGTKNCWL